MNNFNLGFKHSLHQIDSCGLLLFILNPYRDEILDDKYMKNIVLLGAPKAGKTLLAEAMLYKVGITHRRGSTETKYYFRLS